MTAPRAGSPRPSDVDTEGRAPRPERNLRGNAANPARALSQLGLDVQRRLSQSFLTNSAIAGAIAAAADLDREDTILEIGPGLGVLTQHLVESAGRVIAIELDRGLAAALPSQLGNPPNLQVIHADALTVDLGALVSPPYVVVANLPYHVATPILFRLLFHEPRPKRIVAMLQEEVAERAVGRHRRGTFLGTAVATVADARIVRRVAPGSFYPVPKVRSAVVRLDLRGEPAVPREEVPDFVEFLRAGFTQPRKQLRNSLAAGLGITAEQAAALATMANVAPTSRGEQLPLPSWVALYRAWQEHSQAAA